MREFLLLLLNESDRECGELALLYNEAKRRNEMLERLRERLRSMDRPVPVKAERRKKIEAVQNVEKG